MVTKSWDFVSSASSKQLLSSSTQNPKQSAVPDPLVKAIHRIYIESIHFHTSRSAWLSYNCISVRSCNPLPPCCVIVKPCQPRCPPSPCCPPPTLCAPACPQPDPRSAPLLLPNSIDQRISQRVTFINLSAAFSVRCCPKPMVVSFKCPTSVSPMAPREDCPQQVSWPSPPKIDMCCSSNCPPKERDMCFMTVRPMPPSCCPPKGNCGGISGGNGSRQCCKPRWNGSPITKCASQSVDFSVPPLASLSQR